MWSQIVEIDAGEGLVHVQFAGLAFGISTVPIEESVGGVAVLLNLRDEASCADGVAASARDEKRVSSSYWDAVEQ